MWKVNSSYNPINEDDAIYNGEYQLLSTTSTLPAIDPSFCGSQCFLSVRNTGAYGSPSDGWITQVAYSYSNSKIAIRCRQGANSSNPLVWSRWRII